MSETNETAIGPDLAYVATVATLSSAKGDRWLNADACAVHLGMLRPDGRPNRRGFLERVACRPGFPKGLDLGNQKVWKKSEVEEWAEDERRVNRAA